MEIIKTTPDRQKAASLLDTVGLRLDLVALMKNSDLQEMKRLLLMI